MGFPGCGSCAFFSPAPNGGFRGQCRFRAPLVMEGERGPRTVWPLVREHDWCGEHAIWVDDEEE